MIDGLRIIEDVNCLEATDERLFPASRHRSARVRKKLVKRFGGEFRKVPCAFQTARGLFIHPALAAELRRDLKATVARQNLSAFYYGYGGAHGTLQTADRGRHMPNAVFGIGLTS